MFVILDQSHLLSSWVIFTAAVSYTGSTPDRDAHLTNVIVFRRSTSSAANAHLQLSTMPGGHELRSSRISILNAFQRACARWKLLIRTTCGFRSSNRGPKFSIKSMRLFNFGHNLFLTHCLATASDSSLVKSFCLLAHLPSSDRTLCTTVMSGRNASKQITRTSLTHCGVDIWN